MTDANDAPDYDAIRLRFLLNDEQWPVLGGYLPRSPDDRLLGAFLWDQEARELHYMPNAWANVRLIHLQAVEVYGALIGDAPEQWRWQHFGDSLYGVPMVTKELLEPASRRQRSARLLDRRSAGAVAS